MIELFEKKLAGWKKNFLSKRDRYTLIKSILANLPIYYLSTITILVNAAKMLEAIQNRFLWSDEDEDRKFHVVKWNDIKKPINNHGGLGIRSMIILNEALQGSGYGDT